MCFEDVQNRRGVAGPCTLLVQKFDALGPKKARDDVLFLAPDLCSGYDSTAEEYRATKIPEQAAVSRSSSQKSGPRGSPMQPRPAGVRSMPPLF